MKFFQIFFLIYSATSLPIDDYKIIFRDDIEDTRIDDSADDYGFGQTRFLSDSNMFESDNDTEQFFYDEQPFQKLENDKLFQGDIMLLPGQLETLNATDDDDWIGTRTGLISEIYRWPKNGNGNVIVPFTLSQNFSSVVKLKILLAMNDIEKNTCVIFKNRQDESDYIHIFSGHGCYSYLGRAGGRQHLSLELKGCFSRGIIIHELIHALGYDHMHNHKDRDSYVTIYWRNIKRGLFENFHMVNPRKFSNFETPYDYFSVMHYSSTAFSKNHLRTIVPKVAKFRNVIGQRLRMSVGDAKRIKNMYKC